MTGAMQLGGGQFLQLPIGGQQRGAAMTRDERRGIGEQQAGREGHGWPRLAQPEGSVAGGVAVPSHAVADGHARAYRR